MVLYLEGQGGRGLLALTFCGSQVLAPYTTQCVGVDLSEKMVEAYNARARNQVGSVSFPWSFLLEVPCGFLPRRGGWRANGSTDLRRVIV